MGEARKPLFEPEFNRSIKIRAIDERLSSDAGVLLLREADHRLGLVESLSDGLYDPRDQRFIRYTLTELIRERIFAVAMGYNAADDADRLAHDPAMKMAVWDRPGEKVLDERLASQPTQSRLTRTLASIEGNREALRAALPDWIERHLRASGNDHAVMNGTIDLDSFPVPVRGMQEGRAYNGHYRDTVYHPLVASFAPDGDYDSHRLGDGFVNAVLRNGNAASAEGAPEFIETVLTRCSGLARRIDFRMDAAFATGEIMDQLTDRKVRFVALLKRNTALDRLAEPYVNRPVGRPPKDGYEWIVDLGSYQSERWRHAQRLILVIVDKPDPRTGQLQLRPHYFFLITSWKEKELSADEVLEHYRRRGTFEDRIGEMSKDLVLRLSSPKFRENEATLLLFLLGYNLLNMIRSELESTSANGWDTGRVQKTVLKAGARVVKKSRRLLVDVAQAVIPLWERLIRRIRRWRLPPGCAEPRGPRQRVWMPLPDHAHRTLVLKT